MSQQLLTKRSYRKLDYWQRYTLYEPAISRRLSIDGISKNKESRRRLLNRLAAMGVWVVTREGEYNRPVSLLTPKNVPLGYSIVAPRKRKGQIGHCREGFLCSYHSVYIQTKRQNKPSVQQKERWVCNVDGEVCNSKPEVCNDSSKVCNASNVSKPKTPAERVRAYRLRLKGMCAYESICHCRYSRARSLLYCCSLCRAREECRILTARECLRIDRLFYSPGPYVSPFPAPAVKRIYEKWMLYGLLGRKARYDPAPLYFEALALIPAAEVKVHNPRWACQGNVFLGQGHGRNNKTTDRFVINGIVVTTERFYNSNKINIMAKLTDTPIKPEELEPLKQAIKQTLPFETTDKWQLTTLDVNKDTPTEETRARHTPFTIDDYLQGQCYNHLFQGKRVLRAEINLHGDQLLQGNITEIIQKAGEAIDKACMLSQ